MAFIPVDQVASVELRYLYFGEQVENTLYFYNTDNISPGHMTALGNYIDDWWNAQIKPLQSTAVIMREIYITDLSDVEGPTVTNIDSAGLTGAVAGSAGQPGNVSIALSYRSSARGRSGRGRNYFIGLTEFDVVENTVLQAKLDAITLAYEELIVNPPTDWYWAVVSRYHDNAPRTEGIARAVISCGFTDNWVDSQRRRLKGRGS